MAKLHELLAGFKSSGRRTKVMPSGFFGSLGLNSKDLLKKEVNPPSFSLPGTLKTRDGEYQIIETFTGGEATVFRARDLLLGRDSSLRKIDPETRTDLVEVVKVLNRARKNNPVIASSTQEIYGLRTGTDGSEYLEMEWIDGKTLDEFHMENSLSKIVTGLATILKALAGQELVHRDIKPSNIVLQGNSLGRIKLLDCFLLREFGENEGTRWDRKGTTAYAAPEQRVENGYFGRKTDIYALGIVIWERLSGKTANGPNYHGSFEKRFPELVNSDWRKIVEGCTQVEYDKRWSADDILADFRREKDSLYRPKRRYYRWR